MDVSIRYLPVAVATRDSAPVSSSLSLAAQAESAGSEESRDRGITGPTSVARPSRCTPYPSPKPDRASV